MELITGQKYIYTSMTDVKSVVTFIQDNHESYTKQVEFENGKKIWVIARQLRPIEVNQSQ